MTSISRILVPTDFSTTSREAFGFAKTLADTFGASVHLVHAFEDPFAAALFAPEVYAPLPPDLRQNVLHDIERHFTEWLPDVDRARLKGTSKIVDGPTAKGIVDYARRLGADLIVIGTHGRTGLAHVMLGSVAERVVREAPCPVLTVRQTPHRIRRILVPTDFSATADAALDHALLFAARFGASLELLHVLDDPFVTEGLASEAYIAEAPMLRSAMLREAQNRLAHRVAPLRNAAEFEGWPALVRVDAEVLFGHGAGTIAEYAETRNVDLVVMGTHGRTGVTHLLMGSVAEKLVRTAPCPVLTVRPAPGTKQRAEIVYDVEHLPA